MRQRVTRNDVAKLAGVSPAVVSYVINDSNYVSQEKREAVLKAVKELEYTPNVFATVPTRLHWLGIPYRQNYMKSFRLSYSKRGFSPVCFTARRKILSLTGS